MHDGTGQPVYSAESQNSAGVCVGMGSVVGRDGVDWLFPGGEWVVHAVYVRHHHNRDAVI